MSYFEDQDQRDAVRFSWNLVPSTKAEADKLAVPFGCLYTPLKQRKTPQNYKIISGDPVTCKNDKCNSVLNPFCRIDFHSKSWGCPFCGTANVFPGQYSAIQPNSLPYELFPQNTSIEYTCLRQTSVAPIFLFVIDTCLADEELTTVKKSILEALALIPDQCLVGAISYGNVVQLHELQLINDSCSRVFVFKGDKDYTGKQIEEQLGLSMGLSMTQSMTQQNLMNSNSYASVRLAPATTNTGSGRFLQPLGQCRQTFSAIVSEITPDPWPVLSGHRPLRCTGAALSLAVGLLEHSFPNTGARIMTFIGGACTLGTGKVVSSELKDTIRSHRDISHNNAPLMVAAHAFYTGLAGRSSVVGHAIDVFSCSLDQTGLHEMRNLVNMTGGHMVLCDTFTSQLFTHSLPRLFSMSRVLHRLNANTLDSNEGLYRENDMSLNVSIEVKTTSNLQIAGCIGNVASADKRALFVSNTTQVGICSTNEWRTGHLDHHSTLGFYFQVLESKPTPSPTAAPAAALVQFKTTFSTMTGQRRVIVTTVSRSVLFPPINDSNLGNSFDQEAATVLLARYAVFKAERIEHSNNLDMTKYIDKTLITLCSRFARYTKNIPASFELASTFTLFPQFMFHLRRSQLIQVFNNSPDESAFYRSRMFKADVWDSALMIQPSLRSFELNSDPGPVLLDSTSIKPQSILLLDTFFYILIFHGTQVASWRKQGYHQKQEYKNFAMLLSQPVNEAKLLIKDRFPIPRYIDCDQGGSQARFLLSKVNPSTSSTATPNAQLASQQYMAHAGHSASGAYDPSHPSETSVFTDDVNLQVFIDHLKKYVTTPH